MTTGSEPAAPARVVYLGRTEFHSGEVATVFLDVRVGEQELAAGSHLWLCMDIRQGCGPLQAADPTQPGYVSAQVASSGARLPGSQPGPAGMPCRSMDWLPDLPEFVYLVEFQIPEALAAGESIRIQIGGDAGFALPVNSIDAFHLWVLVDAGGDVTARADLGGGYFRSNYSAVALNFVDKRGQAVLPPRPVPTSPHIRISGGAPERLLTVAPSVVGTNQPFVLRASLVDGRWNPADAAWQSSQVVVKDGDKRAAAYDVKWQQRDGVDHCAWAEIPGIAKPGDYTLEVQRSAAALNAGSNAVSVVPAAPQFTPYWGDLHSMLFDQRPFADYFTYARDTMLLDFGACMLFSYNIVLGTVWDDLSATVERFHEPGRFVTFHAVECGITNGGTGHKNVYMMENAGTPFMAEVREPAARPIFRQRIRPDAIIVENLEQFWAEIERRNALVLCHHTVEWTHHNPRFERGAEVYSKWGRSEYSGNPDWHLQNRPLQEELANGLKLGIVAGTDTHDSRACNPAPEWVLPYPGGLTGVFARSFSREDLWEALFARRTCATTGTRTAVTLRLGDHWMGEEVTAPANPTLSIGVLGTVPIARLALIRDNETVALWNDRPPVIDLTWSEPERLTGAHYYYLRVTQSDGNVAWSSPIWITST